MSTESASASASAGGMGFFTVALILTFLTGQCETCNPKGRDYLGDAIDAIGVK